MIHSFNGYVHMDPLQYTHQRGVKINKDIAFVSYANLPINSQFKLRVTHHDTKINNVLFDQNNKGLYVIDLDTVMPGYFISDVGDMIRTYLHRLTKKKLILKGFLFGLNFTRPLLKVIAMK